VGDLRRNRPRRPAGLHDDFPLLESTGFHEKELLFLLLEPGNLLAQKFHALVIRDPRRDIERGKKAAPTKSLLSRSMWMISQRGLTDEERSETTSRILPRPAAGGSA
jgi:hypothetical protein